MIDTFIIIFGFYYIPAPSRAQVKIIINFYSKLNIAAFY